MTVTLNKPQAQVTREGTRFLPDGCSIGEYHWTVEAFYRAMEAGVFQEPERLELIQGRIIENMGQNPPHSSLATEIAEMLRDALKPQFQIREEKPIHIAFDGEPIPDISVLQGPQMAFRKRHPAPKDVALLVEVADTSVDYELGGKALLYAQAGITDYWVVLVNGLAIVRHRQPTPEGYQDVTWLAGAETISPLAAPETVWTVEDLLGNEQKSGDYD